VLPPTRNHLIIINRQIGALRLGLSYKKAMESWPRAKCTPPNFLDFEDFDCGNATGFDRGTGGWPEGEPGPNYRGARFGVDVHTGIYAVDLEVVNPRSPGSLGAFKTSKKIGIGSTFRALCKAYPKVIMGTSHNVNDMELWSKGDKVVTDFYTDKPGLHARARLNEITISRSGPADRGSADKPQCKHVH
jgi:hypothetical protein